MFMINGFYIIFRKTHVLHASKGECSLIAATDYSCYLLKKKIELLYLILLSSPRLQKLVAFILTRKIHKHKEKDD